VHARLSSGQATHVRIVTSGNRLALTFWLTLIDVGFAAPSLRRRATRPRAAL